MNDLRAIARQLGGDVAGRNTVNCPGPGHSHRDRSLSVSFVPRAPGGFLVFSHAGDDPIACKDYIRHRLGLEQFQTARNPSRKLTPSMASISSHPHEEDGPNSAALEIWKQSGAPHGTIVERYLNNRGLALPDGIEGIRFHGACPFGAGRAMCMIGLYRDILTDEPRAIHRTALSHDGSKIDRKALGAKRGCAIKLDNAADVSVKLTIGEGIETCLAAAAEGFRPIWAVGDANGIAYFPILNGVESLAILVDHDASDAGQTSAAICTKRWVEAGREVFQVVPDELGQDMADIARSK